MFSDRLWLVLQVKHISSLHQPAGIYCFLAFSWSQLSTKSSMKRKILSTAVKPVRKYQCFDVTRQSPGSIFRGHFNHAPATSDSGLGPVQQSAKNLPSAPYRAICDISIVNTRFLHEDDVHMIFLSLFLCSWSLSCNRKVFSLPPSAWRCCSVAVMESELQARDRIGVQDFVLLEDFQSEDAFLENLKKRYNSGLIYVSTRNT